jgi:fibronectin type 3 domain-containing protein
MQGVYIDTSSLLRGDITYMYAVLAKNTSHMYSAMSDTVYSTPRLPVVVDAPQGMSARVDKENIYVNWRSTFDTEPVLSGYRVYRREGSAVWTALADTLQDAEQNHVLDEQVQPGVRYEYAVRAYSISGDSSAMSSVASAVIPLPSIYPPGNIRAFRQGAAIILQWDEIAQPSAKEFRIYRYTRGSDARLLGTVPLDTRVFLDDRPGDTSPLFYYLTTVGSVGNESNPSKEVAVR